MLAISLAILALGYFAEMELAVLVGAFATFVFGAVFLFFVLPIRLQGKRWWRQM